MRGFILLIRQQPGLLSFGFLLTLFSSFGQTFLLSLYVPNIAEAIGATTGEMGRYYAMATLGSAALLTYIGKQIDYVELRRYGYLVAAGYVLALSGLSLATASWSVVLGLLGLRLCGQGLMGHISVTSMARYFQAARGKAISLATMGFPAGEALFPLVIAALIAAYDWRWSLRITAVFIALALPLTLWYTLRNTDTQPPLLKAKRSEHRESGLLNILSTRAFWIIAPNVFLLGFINTALFFYQVDLGATKGWTKTWVAGSLTAFALSSALSMLTAGPLVDRFTARRIFPFYLVPYVMGLLALAFFRNPLIYPLSLFLLGFSNGLGSTIKNALQAELFGTKIIGSVRSLFTVLMVISTALGPLVFGLFIDGGWTYQYVLLFAAGSISLAAAQSFRVWR